MRNLIYFIIKYFSWLVFIFFISISCALLFQNNSYQHHVYLTSANSVTSFIYRGVSNITSYFHLKDINNDLQSRNALLEMEIVNLKSEIKEYQLNTSIDSSTIQPALAGFEFKMAEVINNSISKPYNYITINKGSIDGIEPEMGIVDQNGVIGVVNVVGKHSSRAISLLNPNFRLSCKVKNKDFFGSLVWDGYDPNIASLEEMPRHIKFKKGDTIVTSGYSAVFPPDLIVGTIIGSKKGNNDNFIALDIKLSTDFTQLSTVRVLKNKDKEELDIIENDKNE
ncbi:MAG: rod shape-determining protein MreC [Muribaculaceae bacterium]|nr:rod shape-determining protein MreC [Muribaculaceae bacterium]